MHIHDLIGIGFGPSNIALAIALEERRAAGSRAPDTLFIEKQPGFVWHQNMLLDQAHMQISFLKDLATLRNPASRFTFLNYLHDKDRLQDFINLKTFFPSRHEFNDYLGWAAAQFEDRCAYAEEVLEVLPEGRAGQVELLCVRTRDARGQTRERLTRHLAIGMGGAPHVPAGFQPLKEDRRVFHSSQYLGAIARVPEARRIAVIGAGQSAAEIFMDLQGRSPVHEIDLVMRARAIRPSDDSPFANEIFNASFTDFVFSRPDAERAELLEEFWHTNYAAPDLALVQQIFDVFYRQRVSGQDRHRFLRRHEVAEVQASREGVTLTLRDLNHDLLQHKTYDAVVLATGYERDGHRRLLKPLREHLGRFEVDRNYRLRTTPDFKPAIFLQGACESSHGLSDTLLSVLAIRSDEIGQALLQALAGERSAPPSRLHEAPTH
ncbi:lysine N(6)-hydroxylase/L-ornithine N(5)-oxygenase family protein [Ideonella azotifigens]|uniref:L-ornithine N(5)-monooxygenase PvdA n=1 Tax=Ideonella azotifigens TaxID=513160 RepID=A0ABP3VDP3_9BURK|nr:lysine N(6)-hydroxylase/L-ornithine N(5)-oxygenase family protein [Ideonella azotifigens]MCD2344899.1 lysine N(6)-hydroxylase/L-ornithine N(5)-oxygenase family protein [Ideonella azotifigens]